MAAEGASVSLRDVEVALQADVVLDRTQSFVHHSGPLRREESHDDGDDDNDANNDCDGFPGRFHVFSPFQECLYL